MPTIGNRCHELRIVDDRLAWRIVCRFDADAIVIAEVFSKKSGTTPLEVINTCRRRVKEYNDASS